MKESNAVTAALNSPKGFADALRSHTNNGGTMSTIQKARLAELEAVITRSAQAVWDMAEALREIRNDRLYKSEYGSWEEYLKQRWGISRSWADNAINGVEVRALLAAKMPPRGGIPTTVSQAQVLAPVPDEDKPKVWQDAVRTAEVHGKEEPSKRDVEAAVRRYKQAPPPLTEEQLRQRDARAAINRFSQYVDQSLSALEKALDGLDLVPWEEQDALAHRVVMLTTAAIRMLRDRNLIREDVAQQVMDVDDDMVGRVEVVA